jgi:hypothetical protein
MNGRLDPEAIRALLDDAVNLIDLSTLARLRVTRLEARARYDTHGSTLPSLLWAGRRLNADWRVSAQSRRIYHLASALLFVAIVFIGLDYWQEMMADEASDGDLDIAILTDELPIQFLMN